MRSAASAPSSAPQLARWCRGDEVAQQRSTAGTGSGVHRAAPSALDEVAASIIARRSRVATRRSGVRAGSRRTPPSTTDSPKSRRRPAIAPRWIRPRRVTRGRAGRAHAAPLLAGMSGNLMEWYDRALRGPRSDARRLFFHGNRLVALLSVFGVFAAGYVMRIVGGAWFERRRSSGRRRALVSAVAMAVATSLISYLPTYAAAGIVAPLLFTALHLVRGAVGRRRIHHLDHLPDRARAPVGPGAQGSFSVAYRGRRHPARLGDGQRAVRAVHHRAGARMGVAPAVSAAVDPARTVAHRAARSTARRCADRGNRQQPERDRTARFTRVWRLLRSTQARSCAARCWATDRTPRSAIAVFRNVVPRRPKILPESSALSLETASIAFMVVLTPLRALGDRFEMTEAHGGGRPGQLPHQRSPAVPVPGERQQHQRHCRRAHCSRPSVATALSPYQVPTRRALPRALRASGLGPRVQAAPPGSWAGLTPLACAALTELTGSELAPGAYVAFACLVSLLVALRTPDSSHARASTRSGRSRGQPRMPRRLVCQRVRRGGRQRAWRRRTSGAEVHARTQGRDAIRSKKGCRGQPLVQG